MQIDWITVAAQIVNFLVLVWILQRLLYRPVTRAMARRKAAIQDDVAAAEQREAEAADEAERLRQERRDLDDRRDAILQQARDEAQEMRQKLESEAREAVAERREAWEERLSREKTAFLAELRRETAGHIARLSRRVLDDLAGAELEPAVVDTFIDRLEDLDEATLSKLREVAAGDDATVTVASAHDLPEPARARLCDALAEALPDAPPPGFDRDGDLICGIRLKIGGQTLQWSVASYLDDLEEEVAGMLNRNEVTDDDGPPSATDEEDEGPRPGSDREAAADDPVEDPGDTGGEDTRAEAKG